MATRGKKISEQTLAASLDGNEIIPFAKNGANGAVKASKIKEYVQPDLTAKQDKLINSADITVGEDDKLTVTDAAVKKAFIKRWKNLGTIYVGALQGTYDEETDLFTVMWNTKYPESRKYQPYFTYEQAMAALDAVTGPVLGYDSFAPRIPANLPPHWIPFGVWPELHNTQSRNFCVQL